MGINPITYKNTNINILQLSTVDNIQCSTVISMCDK